MIALVLRFKLPGLIPELLAPGAELVRSLIADPADLDRHPVGPQHAQEADQFKLLGQEAVSQRP